MDSNLDLWVLAEQTIPNLVSVNLLRRLKELYVDMYLEDLIPNEHFDRACRLYLYARDRKPNI